MSDILKILIEALTFGTVFSTTLAVAGTLGVVWTLRRRMAEERVSRPGTAASLFAAGDITNKFLRWVQSSTSISNSAEREKLRRELALAGFESPSAPIWFVIARFLLAVGLPVVFLFTEPLFSKPLSGFWQLVWPLVLCCVGLLAPKSFIERRAKSRSTEIEYEFPDALDLLVVCVEAGLSLEAAFVRVGREVRVSHPRISHEFGRVSEELSAGRMRSEALRAMAERTNVAGIRSFVNLVIQTEGLGTSIAQSLRTYSVEMRETRLIRAEEKALRIPVLMTIPLVGCILPVILTALLLPAVIDVMRTLLPALATHGAP